MIKLEPPWVAEVIEAAARHTAKIGPAGAYAGPYSNWMTSLEKSKPKAISGAASSTRYVVDATNRWPAISRPCVSAPAIMGSSNAPNTPGTSEAAPTAS